MQPQTVRGLTLWMQKLGMKVNEQIFFQMAYFHVYQKAEPRCEACFQLYLTKGVVPLFVRQFIHFHFVFEGGHDAQKAQTATPSS